MGAWLLGSCFFCGWVRTGGIAVLGELGGTAYVLQKNDGNQGNVGERKRIGSVHLNQRERERFNKTGQPNEHSCVTLMSFVTITSTRMAAKIPSSASQKKRAIGKICPSNNVMDIRSPCTIIPPFSSTHLNTPTANFPLGAR